MLWVDHDGGRCPLCIANMSGRSNYRGHAAYRRPRADRGKVRMLSRRCRTGQQQQPISEQEEREAIAGQQGLEKLAEWLVSCAWDDGSPRARGTLLVFFEGGRFKLCFNDKAENAVGFVSCSSLLDALAEANVALVEAKVDWRARREDPAPNGKRH
jgi:hypothetical protein